MTTQRKQLQTPPARQPCPRSSGRRPRGCGVVVVGPTSLLYLFPLKKLSSAAEGLEMLAASPGANLPAAVLA
jgi:hypothetical protein